MRTTVTRLLLVTAFFGACQSQSDKSYKVSVKDSANISVFVSMLYPKEHLVVKVNGNILMEQRGAENTGDPTRYLYFKYTDSIKEIAVDSYFNNETILHKTFKDTLTNVKQRSIFISRPFPKGMTKKNYKPYGYIPISKSQRNITLVDDYEYYKGSMTY
jgi:hypothetical protein